MNVGLVYDLRSECPAAGYDEADTAAFAREDALEALIHGLTALGFQVEPVGSVTALVAALAKGRRWDLVFNTAEGCFGPGRSALAPALLDAYQIPYTFSDPLVMALCLDKAACKRFLRDLGLPTPDFALVRAETDIPGLPLPFPVFAKPVAAGAGKGAAARAGDRRELAAVCRALLKRYRQPVLVETFLPGREFTVGIVGTGRAARALGALEVRLRPGAEANAYSYVNKERCEELIDYVLVRDAEAEAACALALEAWRGLGCRDGWRVDVKSDGSGRPHFIEVNPLAGIHPEHSDLPILCNQLGIPYADLIRWIVDSAKERVAR
jgi:D-alanine-D-alanine ligase